MANYLFIDCETTGLSSNSAIIELALIPYIDGEFKNPFHRMIKPHKNAHIDLESFKVTKIDVNEIWSYDDGKKVIDDLVAWIDSHETIFNLCAHNVKFDRDNLFRLFCRNGHYGSYITRINNNDICTLAWSRDIFKKRKQKPDSFKLDDLCRFFKIPIDVSHRALHDVYRTTKLFLELEKLKEKQIPVKHDLTYRQKMEKYMDMKYVQMNPEGDVFITKEALVDQDATKFILSFLWDKHIGMIA